MAKCSQMRSTLRQIEVPSDLAGTSAGIFYLLNEIERQKEQADPANDNGPFEMRPFLLTDEFIFF